MTGRLWAFGDVHGCDVPFDLLLRQIAPQPDDTVVLLGDLVDTGPNTQAVLERVLQLEQECQLIAIQGNHDRKMVDALEDTSLLPEWLSKGGQATLDSYGGFPENVPASHRDFLLRMRPFFETATDIFVHASVDPLFPLSEQTPQLLRHQKTSGNEPPHVSGKRVLCGHTPQRDGVPRVTPGWVCLDTFVYGSGWLTALEVAEGTILQANRHREFRSGHLTHIDRLRT